MLSSLGFNKMTMREMELIKKQEIEGKLVQLFFETPNESWVAIVSKLTNKGWVRLVSVASPDKKFVLSTYDLMVSELSGLASQGAI